MKTINTLFFGILFLLVFSCTSEDEDIAALSIVDCELELATDPSMLHIGICSSGSDLASQNEILFYGSKYTGRSEPEDLEIIWTVVSGNMEILSTESSIVDGIRQSVVSIKFAEDFTGGTIGIKGEDLNHIEEYVEMLTPIGLRN